MSDLIINDKQDDIAEILNDDIDIENDEKQESVIADDNEKVITKSAVYQICSGDALSSKEVYQIAAKDSTKMIVFIGPTGSGKTTIETSIYQMFQSSPIGKLYFAGSNTLQGYEQRAFYTRIKSQRDMPATQRTSQEADRPFLHLRLWQSDRDLMNSFIFADLSGESFDTHIGQIDAAKEDFYFMDRSDYIVGVLDGKRLMDKRKVQSTVSGIIELVRTFYDSELINEECSLQIVFSKYDLLSQLADADKLISKIKMKIEKRLQGMFGHIEYFKVSAMPDDTEQFKVGYGLEELTYSWIKKQNQEPIRKKMKFAELSEFDRLYNKFLGVKE